MKRSRFVHAGEYVTEVEVDSIPSDEACGPYLSLADALKLQDAENALKAGDVKAASKLGRIYEMKPVAAE